MADRCVRSLHDDDEPGFTRVIESATQLAESGLHTFQNNYLEFTLNEDLQEIAQQTQTLC